MIKMRRWLAAAVVCLAGCTSISGLDKNYNEVACFPLCDGGSDASNDVTVEGSSDAHDELVATDAADAQDGGPLSDAQEAGEAGCTDGTKQCDLLVPQTCVNGVLQAGVACPYVCSAGACTGECVPGDLQCDQQQPQKCDATGTWQNNGSACPDVCSAGVCGGSCASGATQCSLLQPQTCVNGAWQNMGSVCPYVCTGGACSGMCKPNDMQCTGLTPQTCDGTGTWQSGTACQYVCTAGTCSGMCTPTTTECVNNTPQTCSPAGAWVSGTACGVETCTGGACSCVAPAMTCNGVCAACNTPTNATPTCTGATCSFTCNSTYSACGSSCVDLQSDGANCGGCGHACGAGSTCSSGACSPIVVCAEAAGMGTGSTMSILRPAATTILFDSSAGNCIGVGGCSYAILSCPTGGTSATPVVVTSGGGFRTAGVLTDGLGGFDFDLLPKPTSLGSGGLSRYTSGATSRLTSIEPSAWVTDFSSGHVFYPDANNANELDELLPEDPTDAGFSEERECAFPAALTAFSAAGGYVYIIDSSLNQVLRYSDQGNAFGTCGTATAVASGLSSASLVMGDTNGSSFYFADANGIHVCASAGTGCHTIAPNQGAITQMAYDANNLYWIGSAGLSECAKAGCSNTPLVLAPNLATTDALDVDPTGSNVYYLLGTTIYRLNK